MERKKAQRNWTAIKGEFARSELALKRFCQERGLSNGGKTFEHYVNDGWEKARHEFRGKLEEKTAEKVLEQRAKERAKLEQTWDAMLAHARRHLAVKTDKSGNSEALPIYKLKDLAYILKEVTQNKRLLAGESTTNVGLGENYADLIRAASEGSGGDSESA